MSSIAVPLTVTRGDSPARAQRARRRIVVAWTAPDNMEHPDWVAAGLSLGELGRVSNWWVGDWLRYGTSRWGEKYAEAARITGFDGKTLRNIVYVVSRFDLSRRRDKLTWSHHAELAVLDCEAQDRWLDRAIADRLSVADLRQELRCSQRRPTANGGQVSVSTASPDITQAITCPHCGTQVPLPQWARESPTTC